jgi:glutamate-1-semialdehyde 2,1-aminomutase
MTAGLALLDALAAPGVYEELDRLGVKLATGLCRAAETAGQKVHCNRVGSMSTMFFTDAVVEDWAGASTSDTTKYAAFFRGMLEAGFTIAPSQFEACFVSLAHTDEDIDAFVSAAAEVLATV